MRLLPIPRVGLRALKPEASREEFLDDLVLFEAAVGDNHDEPLERLVLVKVLRLLRTCRGCKMVKYAS
jgi:hypothetical protein